MSVVSKRFEPQVNQIEYLIGINKVRKNLYPQKFLKILSFLAILGIFCSISIASPRKYTYIREIRSFLSRRKLIPISLD